MPGRPGLPYAVAIPYSIDEPPVVCLASTMKRNWGPSGLAGENGREPRGWEHKGRRVGLAGCCSRVGRLRVWAGSRCVLQVLARSIGLDSSLVPFVRSNSCTGSGSRGNQSVVPRERAPPHKGGPQAAGGVVVEGGGGGRPQHHTTRNRGAEDAGLRSTACFVRRTAYVRVRSTSTPYVFLVGPLPLKAAACGPFLKRLAPPSSRRLLIFQGQVTRSQ